VGANERKTQLQAAWETVVGKMSLAENPAPKEKDFFSLVEEARQEWQAAMIYFNHVADPELVDYAVYALEAAERKYTYLLKKAHQENYSLPAKLDSLREGRRSGGY